MMIDIYCVLYIIVADYFHFGYILCFDLSLVLLRLLYLEKSLLLLVLLFMLLLLLFPVCDPPNMLVETGCGPSKNWAADWPV